MGKKVSYVDQMKCAQLGDFGEVEEKDSTQK